MANVGLVLVAGLAMGAVTVKPLSVREVRSRELATRPSDERGFGMSMGSGVTVRVRLEGPEAASATQYRKLKIVEAKDDTGRT
jgi:hypothetical protein